MIFGRCINEALFFTESQMILTGFLEKEKTLKMNLNLRQMKRVSEIKLFLKNMRLPKNFLQTY